MGSIITVVLIGLIEVVDGDGVVGRVSHVDAVAYGNRNNADTAFDRGIRTVGRNDIARLFIGRNGDVRPPVHAGFALAVVDDTHTAVQEGCVLGKEEVHLMGDGTDAFKGIEAQDGNTDAGLFCRQRCREDLRAGVGMVTDDRAAVPFDAARCPCVAQSQVCGTVDVVCHQQFTACVLVVKRPELAACLGNEGCADVVVFEDVAVDAFSRNVMGVVVLRLVGECRGDAAVAEPQSVVVAEHRGRSFGIGVRAVDVVEQRQGRCAVHDRRTDVEGGFCESCHGGASLD